MVFRNGIRHQDPEQAKQCSRFSAQILCSNAQIFSMQLWECMCAEHNAIIESARVQLGLQLSPGAPSAVTISA